MSEYIIVEGTRIRDHLSGPFPEGNTNARAVPASFEGHVGDDTREFDSDWRYRPLVDRVSEGLVPVPFGLKLASGQLQQMQMSEMIAVGLVHLEEGTILDGEDVRPMTPSELGRAGLVLLPVLQAELCAMADSWGPVLLAHGFEIEDMTAANGRYSASDALISRATGVLAAVTAGLPSATFPLDWPDGDDNPVQILTVDDLKKLADAMFRCVRDVSRSVGTVKAAIRAATSTGSAADIFDAWEAAVKGVVL